MVGDQADFPVLVSLTSDADLASKARDNGFDIAFTSSNGTTKLAHEIEKFDGQTGGLAAWVKVPMLSSAADTVIYMYYGNPTAADQQDRQAVWPGYEGVWHLSQASGSGAYLSNSAINDYHATPFNTFFNSSGKIDGARRFVDNEAHRIQFDNEAALFNGWNRWTFGFWIYPDYPSDASWEASGEDQFLQALGPIRLGRVRREGWEDPGLGTLQIDIQFSNAGTIFVWPQINRQAWNHIVYTYDGTDLTLFFNGVQVARVSAPGDSLIEATWFYIGGTIDTLNGSLDELRISSRGRSSGWVLTEYNNQASPGSFIRLGSETSGPACSP